MINPIISADRRTTKPIAAFSCTSHVQEVHTKADVVHLSPLNGIIQLSRIGNVLRNISLTRESLENGLRPSRLQHSLVHHVYKK